VVEKIASFIQSVSNKYPFSPLQDTYTKAEIRSDFEESGRSVE
jgi:hypothetical protein